MFIDLFNSSVVESSLLLSAAFPHRGINARCMLISCGMDVRDEKINQLENIHVIGQLNMLYD